MVGVGHAHFSLYLGSPQGRVDIPRALSLLCLPQFREPAPHVPAEGEMKERKGGGKGETKKDLKLTFGIHTQTHAYIKASAVAQVQAGAGNHVCVSVSPNVCFEQASGRPDSQI